MRQTDASRRRYLAAVGGASLAALGGCLGGGAGDDPTDTEASMDDDSMDNDSMTDDGTMTTTFEVAVENVSTGDTLETMDGSVAVPLSPGVYAVHSGMAGLFTPGEAASDGLEALAEDGAPGTLAGEVEGGDDVLHSGAFTTPAGADDPAPLLPGDSYAFEVEASGDADPALSLATMFVQSNDLFYAPAPGGVPLFEGGDPVEGDVTDSFDLWDAGTEENQPPGEGGDQAPRQSEAGAGTDEMASVRAIGDVDDGFEYPAVADVLQVTVTTT
jgi:hypothetical protein